MNSSDIYARLVNDILFSKYPDIYYINQENDINVMNTHKKPARRRCLDYYQIIKIGATYNGDYGFDNMKSEYIESFNCLSFSSFSKNSGLDFLDFINSVINADPNIFVHVKGLEICDLRKKLLNTEKILISNTQVDNLLLTLIKRYFRNLNELIFDKCIIKKECDFSKLNKEINFNSCVIEDFRVFNDTESQLKFSYSKINKISNTIVNSKTIVFDNINLAEVNYEELFLKCNFLKLEYLRISPELLKFGISYKNKFRYLPRSAPNLEKFILAGGKLSNFDFISDMKNILECTILSVVEDSCSLASPFVDSKKESEKLKKRNIDKYQIQKILNPDEEDKYIIGSLELDRILSLAHFNKLIDYSMDEYIILKENANLIEYLNNKKINDGAVTKFYESYYDTLKFKNTSNDLLINVGLEDTYIFQENFIYIDKDYALSGLEYKKDRIVLAKSFMYNYDLKPIIFMNKNKSITTIDEAVEFSKTYCVNNNPKYGAKKEDYNLFIEQLKQLKDEEEEISIHGLNFMIGEIAGFEISPSDFINFGEGGRHIAGMLEKCDRCSSRDKEIYQKNLYYRKRIKELIVSIYEKLTLEEKAFLLRKKEDYKINQGLFYTKTTEEECSLLVESIDFKTDGLYSKYFNMLKLTYEQTKMKQPELYDKIIEKEYIKKLDLSNI